MRVPDDQDDHRDVHDAPDRVEQRVHHQPHARVAADEPQRPQHPQHPQDLVIHEYLQIAVAVAVDAHVHDGEDYYQEVQLTPAVAQVAAAVQHEALRDHLHHALHDEDEVDRVVDRRQQVDHALLLDLVAVRVHDLLDRTHHDHPDYDHREPLALEDVVATAIFLIYLLRNQFSLEKKKQLHSDSML